jgi:tellurite resistance protein TehA-like permease
VAVRRPAGRDLPMRAYRIDNLTIGRPVTPRRPTVWTHMGPGLVIQAMIGIVVLAIVAGSLWARR